MDMCKLCGIKSVLQKSHVIPHSIIKDIKDGDSQLYVCKKDLPPTYSNADPKEPLFCRDCEQYLSEKYEKYGAQLLKNYKNVVKHDDYIEFKSFDYKKWYLYYLSIIWRVSIYSLSEFENIDLGVFNDILKVCIKNNNLAMSETISIDECILITMSRVRDRSQRLPDKYIKHLMLNFMAVKKGNDRLFFFMHNGFLVQYQLTPQLIIQKKESGFKRSDSSRLKNNIVKFIDITESKLLCENFNVTAT